MYKHIHNKIEVQATFTPNKNPIIHSFEWESSKYKILKTTLVTKARRGRESVWMFHVATETAAFKLRLDTDSLIWWLEEYSWEESR